MNTSTLGSVLQAFIRAFDRGGKTRLALYILGVLFVAVFLLAILNQYDVVPDADARVGAIGLLLAMIVIVLAILALEGTREAEADARRRGEAEAQARQHPEEPRLAWEVARQKLKSYLDRNLAEVRSIFWLTLFVMLGGLGFVLYGLQRAFEAPDSRLSVAVVASASGVLISFIRGHFSSSTGRSWPSLGST
jgi:hypothetical protein